ncbi:MAG: AMP-binding protein, partial [Candidatus Obscuribacterales bacterium]|nr:AMP-binding protein [Candidatus Obscuribacterales bacterium]
LRLKGIKKGDRIALLGWNCPEWVFSDLAAQSLGAVVVAIYPNSSDEQVDFIIKDSGALLTFSDDPAQLKRVTSGEAINYNEIVGCLNAQAEAAPLHTFFIPNPGAEIQNDPGKWFGVRAELRAIEAALHTGNCARLENEQLATLIYTSGSTGVPKGCMITHGNIAAALSALTEAGFQQSAEQDTYLSYLPLAHVFERINGMGLSLRHGVPVAFCSVHEVKKGLLRHKPTMLCGTPAVWRKIKEGIDAPEDKLPKTLNRLGLWKPLLNWALSRKPGSIGAKLAEKFIVGKIRAKLGGKLKLLASGGAPISPELLEFFNALGMELLNGYGSTETTGGITTNRPSIPGGELRNKVGTVGQPLPGCKVRIVFEPGEEDAGGEIQIFSEQLFIGYWKNPEATSAAFTEDGWFKTGDIGFIDEDGFLHITGRKDGNEKTEHGKYVAREKVQLAFENFSVIHHTVPIIKGRKFVSALIFLNVANARSLVKGDIPANVEVAAFLSTQPEVLAAVEQAVAGANSKLEKWEQVKKFRIMPLETTVANGLLTAVLKLRVKEVLSRFKPEIEALYS